MKKILNRINKKVLNCPQCSQTIRVPIKLGKRLRITCPQCKSQFDIAFKNPLSTLLQWNKQASFSQNIASITAPMKQLPFKAKLTLVLLLFSILYLSISLISPLFFNPSQDTPTAPFEQPIQEGRMFL